MKNDYFSNHIGNASELTMIAKIKPGYVPVDEPITYAARLRLHLRMLGALRRNGLETDRGGVYVGPVDYLGSLQFVRWTLIENDTKMLLSVNFDRALEPYIRRIVDKAGPLLDTILCHCEDFLGHSSDEGFDHFMAYAVKKQVPVELFAAAAPDISVDDGDYFLEIDRKLRALGPDDDPLTWHPKQRLTLPAEKLAASGTQTPLALADQAMNIVRVMYENNHRFPALDFRKDSSRDDLLYYRLTDKLVPGFWLRFASLSERLGHPVDTSAPGWEQTLMQVLPQVLAGAASQPGTPRPILRFHELFQQFDAELRWFATPPEPRTPSALPPMPATDAIQSGLVGPDALPDGVSTGTAPKKATHACLVMLRVDDPAPGRTFLQNIASSLFPCADGDFSDRNLSVTYSGLKALGLREDLLRKLPQPFREGMADRAGMLGDIGCNHPREWDWPKSNWPLGCDPVAISPDSVDLVVQIEGVFPEAEAAPGFDANHPLHGAVEGLAQEAGAHQVRILHVEPIQRRYAGNHVQGHLGFADGVSQPVFIKSPTQDNPDPEPKNWDRPFIGELLVGHRSRLVAESSVPEQMSFLRNGTFQVMRKISLDVAKFNHENTVTAPARDPSEVAEKLVGRKKSGDPLIGSTHPNKFDYRADPTGLSVPLQSHVRRTNPREFDTPRLLRRGYSYGPYGSDETTERGLMFLAYNANIAEQFEVIQRWITGGNSTGLSSWHGDPLLAPKRPDGSRTFRYADGYGGVRVDMDDEPPAKLRWGLYAFMPSQCGLNILADPALWPQPDQPDQDPAPIDEIAEWKLFLENADDHNRHERDAFWAEYRPSGAFDAGDYGVLACSHAAVEAVINKEGCAYSTRNHKDRMTASLGVQYLGYDDKKLHEKEREALETFLGGYGEDDFFASARKVAQAVIAANPVEVQSGLEDGTLADDGSGYQTQTKPLGRRIASQDFIFRVIALLAEEWLDVPKGVFQHGGAPTPNPHFPRDILAGSHYVFWPHPTDKIEENAQHKAKRATDLIEQELLKCDLPAPTGLRVELDKVAAKDPDYWTVRKQAEYVTGVCLGLFGPVTGSFRSILYEFVKESQLFRLQQRYLEAVADGQSPEAAAKSILRSAVLDAMAERPVPDLLHRVATKDTELSGTKVKEGDTIVASVRSAILDGGDKEHLLQGGTFKAPGRPALHACPGWVMGIAILTGCFAALFEAGELRPEGPLTLRVRP